jgi:hypothetical protein
MQVQRNEKGLAFLEWCYGPHNKESFKLWMGENMEGMDINFPIPHAEIIRTKKDDLVLVPSPDSVVYLYKIESGYRGTASIDRIEDGTLVKAFKQYHPLTFGETLYALINGIMNQPVDILWRKSGRRINYVAGMQRLWSDRSIEDIIGDMELVDEIEKAKE